jgi:N-methylhydantoinase B
MTTPLDATRVQVAWSRSIAIADQAAAALMRTAVSPIIRESMDLAVVLFDEHGQAMAQSTICIPSFIGTLPATLGHLLAWRPIEQWQPGDVVATNDPWLGTGQLNDLSIVAPIMHRQRIAGFVGVVAHLPDVGGSGGGDLATDTFEEGLNIPPCLLYDRGAPNELIFNFIRSNVRLPVDVVSDITAMKAAVDVCVEKTATLLREAGLDSLAPLSREITSRSERAMRSAIGRVPRGTYTGRIDVEGFDNDLVIHARVNVERDSVSVDFAGTSPQVKRAINATYAHTYAHTAFVIKCMLEPDVPNNAGSLAPISVTAPNGSILGASRPAAGWSRTQVSHYISSLLFQIMSQVVPARVLAEPGSPRPIITFRGEHDDGSAFSTTYHVMSGMGAGEGYRGLSAMAFPTNTRVTPIEFLERSAPVRMLEKTLRLDSAGAGEWSGGLGQRVRLVIESSQPVRLLTSPGRVRFAAQGVCGGGAGETGSLLLNGANIAFASEAVTASDGDELEICSAGGGGYGVQIGADHEAEPSSPPVASQLSVAS